MLDEINKVSVIVPIYNVERYIEKCVKSLMEQDYKNIEIILVDDGSSDRSADIIDRLALKDNRITVIHKENGGVSSARNAGMKVAVGDYIMFVDGDDWVEHEYVSYFLNIVVSSGCSIGMNTKNFYAGSLQTMDKAYMITAEKAIEWIYMGKLSVAVWNKIYDEKGPQYLMEEHRGRKKMKNTEKSNKQKKNNSKMNNSAEKELLKKIEYLETENAYLKKLNALIQDKEKSKKEIK